MKTPFHHYAISYLLVFAHLFTPIAQIAQFSASFNTVDLPQQENLFAPDTYVSLDDIEATSTDVTLDEQNTQLELAPFQDKYNDGVCSDNQTSAVTKLDSLRFSLQQGLPLPDDECENTVIETTYATKVIDYGVRVTTPEKVLSAPPNPITDADSTYIDDAYDDNSCIVVGFGGAIRRTAADQAIRVAVQARVDGGAGYLWIGVSDKPLGCGSNDWVGLVAPFEATYGSGGYSTHAPDTALDTIRYVRIESGSHAGNWQDQLYIASIAAIGTFTPEIGGGVGLNDGIDNDCLDCNNSNTSAGNTSFTANPVNTQNGNYTYGVADLTQYSQGETFTFYRTYSASHVDAYDRNIAGLTLRGGWTHNYAMQLRSPNPSNNLGRFFYRRLNFETGNGARVGFYASQQSSDGDVDYKPEAGFLATLRKECDVVSCYYRMVLSDQTVYYFDEQGFLTRMDKTSDSNQNGIYNELVDCTSSKEMGHRGVIAKRQIAPIIPNHFRLTTAPANAVCGAVLTSVV